jgi:hypothetical protein
MGMVDVLCGSPEETFKEETLLIDEKQEKSLAMTSRMDTLLAKFRKASMKNDIGVSISKALERLDAPKEVVNYLLGVHRRSNSTLV